MVTKGYFRAELECNVLRIRMGCIFREGKQTFLKSIQVFQTQLMAASDRGDRARVQYLLLEKGALVNMRDSVSYTSKHRKSTYCINV